MHIPAKPAPDQQVKRPSMLVLDEQQEFAGDPAEAQEPGRRHAPWTAPQELRHQMT